jgi:hypothetical protein
MSQDSSQKIPQEATKLKKLAKVTARYMEMEQFKDSDHHTGYFCYNCIYFMKPNHCAIVTDEGPDVYDKSSGEIAPYVSVVINFAFNGCSDMIITYTVIYLLDVLSVLIKRNCSTIEQREHQVI